MGVNVHRYSKLASRPRVVDYASGFRGRYFHFLAAWDEQVCSAASDKWRQMLDNQPTHSEVKVFKTVPSLPEYAGFGFS